MFDKSRSNPEYSLYAISLGGIDKTQGWYYAVLTEPPKGELTYTFVHIGPLDFKTLEKLTAGLPEYSASGDILAKGDYPSKDEMENEAKRLRIYVERDAKYSRAQEQDEKGRDQSASHKKS